MTTIKKTPIIQNQNRPNTNQMVCEKYLRNFFECDIHFNVIFVRCSWLQVNASSAPILQHVLSSNQTEHMHVTPNRTNIRHSTSTTLISSAPSIVTSSPSGTSSSSLIKAILANKVTSVDGTVVGTPNITTNIIPSINPSIISATTNVNVHQQVTFELN